MAAALAEWAAAEFDTKFVIASGFEKTAWQSTTCLLLALPILEKNNTNLNFFYIFHKNPKFNQIQPQI